MSFRFLNMKKIPGLLPFSIKALKMSGVYILQWLHAWWDKSKEIQLLQVKVALNVYSIYDIHITHLSLSLW